LRQHQLQRVHHARNLARRKRRAQALEQLRHVAIERLPGNHLPHAGTVAGQNFPAGVHGQRAAVVLRHALRLFADAHGRKFLLTHYVERTGGEWRGGFCQRTPGAFLTVLYESVVPVAEHRRHGIVQKSVNAVIIRDGAIYFHIETGLYRCSPAPKTRKPFKNDKQK
jgi:hypothetical protein